jgi:hypothetical protein
MLLSQRVFAIYEVVIDSATDADIVAAKEAEKLTTITFASLAMSHLIVLS